MWFDGTLKLLATLFVWLLDSFWKLVVDLGRFRVATLLLEEWEDDFHTPEMGTWESVGTPKTSEFNFRCQNTLHWSIFNIIGKLLKCRCRKWARMNHLDICSTSYDKKKGRESNWQFDSRPLKVRNQPNFLVCM
jgi:hypothetical protein